jgi:hypothetical protein
MGTVTTLQKVHVSFYTNASVQEMLKMGFVLADVLEVHGEFFSELSNECEDKEATVGEQTTEARLQHIFGRILDKKLKGITDAESDEMERRAKIFKRVPAKKLKSMTGSEWEELAKRAESADREWSK